MPTTAYETLERRFQRLGALREAAGMLNWDMSTMMPSEVWKLRPVMSRRTTW